MLTRRAAHRTAATALARLDDRDLAALLEGATPLGAGIGGTSASLHVEGVRVFVKKVPLTDLELEHPRSTANLFGLPPFFQYGIGSAGFGAWRELAVQELTTEWVLGGDHAGFPLTHHWRVLPGSSPTPDEHDDLERVIAYWGGSAGVRARFEALRRSSAQLVLFLEFLPQTVHHWLLDRVAEGGEALDSALAMVHRELLATTAFLKSRGVLHFDAHFDNLLTDGERLYFADFGLAISSGFDLSPAESEFFAAHRDYDRCYVVSHLLGWFDRNLDPLPPSAAALARRHRAVADTIGPFYEQLQRHDRDTRYPTAELDRAWELPERTRPGRVWR